MTDYFIIYEEKNIAGHGIRKTMFGYTNNKTVAMNELSRLYHIDPFHINFKYSLEMEQYKPVTGYELK